MVMEVKNMFVLVSFSFLGVSWCFTHRRVGLNLLRGEPAHRTNSQISPLCDTQTHEHMTDGVDQAVIATYE